MTQCYNGRLWSAIEQTSTAGMGSAERKRRWKRKVEREHCVTYSAGRATTAIAVTGVGAAGAGTHD
jgi:hypothetical protein